MGARPRQLDRHDRLDAAGPGREHHYAIGQRHNLAPINIFTLDAKVNENAPEKYRGMDRYEARKAVLAS